MVAKVASEKREILLRLREIFLPPSYFNLIEVSFPLISCRLQFQLELSYQAKINKLSQILFDPLHLRRNFGTLSIFTGTTEVGDRWSCHSHSATVVTFSQHKKCSAFASSMREDRQIRGCPLWYHLISIHICFIEFFALSLFPSIFTLHYLQVSSTLRGLFILQSTWMGFSLISFILKRSFLGKYFQCK